MSYSDQPGIKLRQLNAQHPMPQNEKNKTLHLTIKKRWFIEILIQRKKEEYRIYKYHWIPRLLNKTYAAVLFKNGYAVNAPEITVKCLGITNDGKRFIIKLGEIIEKKNIPTGWQPELDL